VTGGSQGRADATPYARVQQDLQLPVPVARGSMRSCATRRRA
jgi:hypothetical protein